MERILLVEDNENIGEALGFSIKKAGYELCVATTVRLAKSYMQESTFDLCLLDVTLPDGNGFDLYRDTIAAKGIPVIFLTAMDDEDDIVNGLSLGAEDYITKPFSTKELLARVNRVLLRNRKETILRSGSISFDMDRMEAMKDGEVLELSSLERKILHLLFLNHDKAVTRSQVIDLIWDATGNDVYDHTVTVYLKRIREKLGDDIISTIKGVGYRIDLKN